jgi:hypothetical protein
VTPPQFTATQDVAFLSGALAVGPGTQTTPSVRQPSVATKPFQGSAPAQQTAPAPSVTKSSVAPASGGGYSGTVTGASFSARNYGTLSATATFSNGKITNVTASQSPRSWSDNSLSALLPLVNGGKITIEQVKQYSSAQLPCGTSNSCRSQASYTADAFWSSVKSAISKAGL